MNPEKDQIFIFTKSELQLIKDVFADNDELLYAIRKVFLQFELTEKDKGLLNQITPAVYHILEKRIHPTPSNEFPLGQISTLLTTLTLDIKAKTVEEAIPAFHAKATEIAYLDQQFAVLKDPESPQPIQLAKLGDIVGKDHEEAFVGLTVYLFIYGWIDPNLLGIKAIAGQKEETLDQLEKRMRQNSNK